MAQNYDEKIKNMSDRAKEELYNMQSRAMPPSPSFVRPRGGNNFGAQPRRTQENRNAEPEPHEETIGAEHSSQKPSKKGLFGLDILKILDAKGFELDSDRILLLLLIVLLSGEGGDEILIFALAYLML